MSELGTTERVLRLLALLQRRPVWTGPELAAELGVTDRCIRRDISRLRALGYPVRATQGVAGGYQLGAGSVLPPLLLDDEEATATAVSLRLAAGGTVAGAGEAALRTLAKLDQVMPPRLRAQVRALSDATAPLIAPGSQVDGDVLLSLARACRDRLRVRFAYAAAGARAVASDERVGGTEPLGGTSRSGRPDRPRDLVRTERTVEPVRMVATSRRWYLMAWDVDRAAWRTFRLDRMRDVRVTTWRFRAREHPDPVAFVQAGVTTGPYRHVARVLLSAPIDVVREQVPPQVATLTAQPDGRTLMETGGDDLGFLAMHLARMGHRTEILEPEGLAEAARDLAVRLSTLILPPRSGTPSPDPGAR